VLVSHASVYNKPVEGNTGFETASFTLNLVSQTSPGGVLDNKLTTWSYVTIFPQVPLTSYFPA